MTIMRTILPGCKMSGTERMPDALMRRFKKPYCSPMDFAEA